MKFRNEQYVFPKCLPFLLWLVEHGRDSIVGAMVDIYVIEQRSNRLGGKSGQYVQLKRHVAL